MKSFVVRHGKAGSREKWTRPDDIRPLTKPGRAQADALTALLADENVQRVISSPYTRCVQTVEPLAADRGCEVEHDDALAEGARLPDVMDLIERAGDGAVLCTHGDVLEDLIGDLWRRGVQGADPSRIKKGSTWVLERSAGGFTRATYLPPPA